MYDFYTDYIVNEVTNNVYTDHTINKVTHDFYTDYMISVLIILSMKKQIMCILIIPSVN